MAFHLAFHILFSSWVASAIHSPMEDQTEDASFVDAQEQYVCADNKTWKEKNTTSDVAGLQTN